MSTARSELEPLRSERLLAAIDRAAASGEARELLAVSSSVLAGASPRGSLAIARAVGFEIASKKGRVDALCRALAADDSAFWPRAFAAFAFAARLRAGLDVQAADAALQLLAESELAVREVVIAALRTCIDPLGDGFVGALAAWTDGFLQAHVALEALADKTLLARLGDGAASELVARLDEAFALANRAPRSADRSQGLRTLRGELPGQIALFAARYPRAIFPWLEGKLGPKRPETREVIEQTIDALRRASLSHAEAGRLRDALEATKKPPRDPSRIVHGMRGRGKKKS